MTHAQKMVAAGMCSLVLGTGAQAAVNDSDANPYQAIVVRNVFGLKPPPPPPSVEPVKVPPPKVTLIGLFTVLGPKKAILKANLPAKAGEPAKEQTFTLGENEREGEIEVLQIDVKNSTVKVSDYGVETNLVFEKVTSGGGAAPGATAAAGGPAPAPGGVPFPNPGGFKAPPNVRSLRLPGAAAPPSSTGMVEPANGMAMSSPTGSFGTPYGTPAQAALGQPAANLGGLLANPAPTEAAPGGTPLLGSVDSAEALAAAAQRTPEENVLLYEANRAKNEALISAGMRIPRMPQHPFLGGQGGQPDQGPP